jgi:hypothetical protein
MIRNKEVIEEWIAGRKASAGNLSTDGVFLYSYGLKIGEGSGKVILDYTSGGGSYYSQTTSCHVGLAKRISRSATIIRPE